VAAVRFIEKLTSRLESTPTFLCVGLDSRYDRVSEAIGTSGDIESTVFDFNRRVVENVADLAVAFKMNVAFYAGFGAPGLAALRRTNAFLRETFPAIPRIADCKRSEMGESVKMVIKEIFDDLGFDAVMVTPWFGRDTVEAYLEDPARGVAVYIHDSNPSAPEFQQLPIVHPSSGAQVPLFEYVAERIVQEWNSNGNIFLEAGLTYPQQLRRVREVAGEEMPLLVAGLGAQGGKAEDLIGLFGAGRRRLFVNSSRGILFPARAIRAKDRYFEEVRRAALETSQTLLELSLR
jgi:orotidine-5'-phosphate decarboxylase